MRNLSCKLFFIFITLTTAVSLETIHFSSAAEEKPENRAPAGLVVSPNSCLKALEGELILFINDPPRPVQPILWHSLDAGTIEFVTEENGCSYHFALTSKAINNTTQFSKVGILSVTAENQSNSDIQAVIWTAWKNISYVQHDKNKFQGVILGKPFTAQPSVLFEDPWNPAWTWYFKNQMLVHNQSIVYYAKNPEGWKTETWIRRVRIPYKKLTRNEPVGYKRFASTLEQGGKTGFRILVPFKPFPLSLQGKFENQISKFNN